MKILPLLIVFVGFTSKAGDWLDVYKSGKDQISISPESSRLVGNQISTKARFIKDGSADFVTVSITRKECLQGYGQLKYKTIDEKKSVNVDYVANGGSVATNIGDVLCFAIQHFDQTD